MKTEEKLIAVQDEYITFLGKILSDHEVFLHSRGIEPSEGNIKMGEEFRAAISLLKSQIEEKHKKEFRVRNKMCIACYYHRYPKNDEPCCDCKDKSNFTKPLIKEELSFNIDTNMIRCGQCGTHHMRGTMCHKCF